MIKDLFLSKDTKQKIKAITRGQQFEKTDIPKKQDENPFDLFLKQYKELDCEVNDTLFPECIRLILDKGVASTSLMQRKFSIGYTRATKLIDELELMQLISPFRGSLPREIYFNSFEKAIKIMKQRDSCTTEKLEENIQNGDLICLKTIKNGFEFEKFCSIILLRNGFQHIEVTQASNDYGVDILAMKEGVKYAIQCKFYSGNIGNSAVQEVSAGRDYYDCHIGVVMTNSYFTINAKELAKKNKILLWDSEKLNRMIKEYERVENH